MWQVSCITNGVPLILFWLSYKHVKLLRSPNLVFISFFCLVSFKSRSQHMVIFIYLFIYKYSTQCFSVFWLWNVFILSNMSKNIQSDVIQNTGWKGKKNLTMTLMISLLKFDGKVWHREPQKVDSVGLDILPYLVGWACIKTWHKVVHWYKQILKWSCI